MPQVTDQQVLDALAHVRDPDRDADVVSLGMVTGLRIQEGHVMFALEVAPERGPQLEPLRREAEAAVHELPGVLTARAVLTAERQPAPDAPAARGRHGAAAQPELLPGVKAIVAVASGKGGVG